MYQFPIGIILDSFRLPFREAVEKAASLGVQGLQVWLNNPEEYTTAIVRERLDIIKSNGLKVSAVCGDFGHGFGQAEHNPSLIERSKRVMDFTREYESEVVTTHIGVVPADVNHPRYAIMQAACRELAEYADSVGGHFAVETGPEPAVVLKGFLDSLNSRGVGVNFDPANLVMVVGDDPAKAVHTLKDYIVHTHAKDGIKLLDKDPEVIYGLRPEDERDQWGVAFEEKALGDGHVDFVAWTRALEEIGYKGFLTIEREVGEDPVADIVSSVKFLREVLAK